MIGSGPADFRWVQSNRIEKASGGKFILYNDAVFLFSSQLLNPAVCQEEKIQQAGCPSNLFRIP